MRAEQVDHAVFAAARLSLEQEQAALATRDHGLEFVLLLGVDGQLVLYGVR